MKEVLLLLLLATFGNALYHTAQKAMNPHVNPMLILMSIYTLGFLIAALAAPFFNAPGQTSRLGDLVRWPVLAVGIGIFMVEVGFLLAYRTGASLQGSNIAVNGLSSLLLVPVAVYFFQERFSAARVLGIVLTLAGLFLLGRK